MDLTLWITVMYFPCTYIQCKLQTFPIKGQTQKQKKNKTKKNKKKQKKQKKQGSKRNWHVKKTPIANNIVIMSLFLVWNTFNVLNFEA